MGNVHQTNIGPMAKGKHGQLYGDPTHYIEESFKVSEGRASEETTYVVDTATNDADYDITMFGETVTFTADGSATKTEITAGLKALIDANTVMHGVATVVDDTVDTLTITARYPGLDLAISAETALVTVTQTAAESEGETLPFGVVVLHDASDNDKVVSFAAPSARVVDMAPTVNTATSVNWGVEITIEGETYQILYEGDGTATAQEIVEGLTAAVNAQMPANTVIATEDDVTLTLTGEVPGTPFEVSGIAAEDNTWAETITEAGDNEADIAGITRYSYEEASNTIGDASDVGYPPGRDANVLKRGRLYVTGGDNATKKSDVFVGTAVAEKGQIFDADGTGRVKVTNGLIKWHKANVIEILKTL